MCHWCWHYASNGTKNHVTPLNNCQYLQNAMVPSTVLLALSTGTSIGTRCHIIPLNYHLNMMNTTVPLMPPPASHDRKHVIAMYVPKTNKPLKRYICQLVNVHMRQLCQYICPMQTQCNQHYDQKYWHTNISYYWHMSENKYVCHTVYVFPLHCYCSLHVELILLHI